MSFGHVPGVGGHPLFVPVFFLATIANYLAVILPSPVPIELGVMAVPHLAFVAWLVAARSRDENATRDRAGALRELYAASSPTPRSPGSRSASY